MSELIIYTDKEGVMLGTMERGQAIREHKIRAVSRMYVFNNQDKLLIQKRSSTMRLGPGYWDQSAGGHIDPGETPLETAKRELVEETGIAGVELFPMGSMYFEESIDDLHLFSYDRYFACRYNGEITTNVEVDEIRWVSFDELGQMISEGKEKITPGLIHAYENLRERLEEFLKGKN